MPASEASSIGTITVFWFGDCASVCSASMYFSAIRKLTATTSPFDVASLIIRVAVASAWASRSTASAARKAASRRPSASSTTAAFRPSARVMSDWRMPSASRITARFSRSAFICRAIASTRSFGGSMSLISMRVTLMPQGSEAASITLSRRALISSRCDSS